MSMKVYKTSEKILIWLYRENITQNQVAKEIGITRQAFSQKIKDNVFTIKDIFVMRQMGFKD